MTEQTTRAATEETAAPEPVAPRAETEPSPAARRPLCPGEHVCGRADCGAIFYGGLGEPWCPACARRHAAEYRAIFRGWVIDTRAVHLRAAGVPERFENCGLDNFEAKGREHERATAAILGFVEGAEITRFPGLYLHGPAGTGKTHLAVAALLELLAQRRAGRFVSANELMLECREAYRLDTPLSHILDAYSGPGVLLLDDLGAEKVSEFSRQVLVTLVDRAYARRRPRLLLTSNLTLDQVGAKLDERIADRLREMCLVLRLGGTSHRRRIAASRAE